MNEKILLTGMRIILICGIIALFTIPVTVAMPALPPGIPSSEQEEGTGYMPGFLLIKSSNSGINQNSDALTSAHATINAEIVRDFSAEGVKGLQLVALPDTISVEEAVSYYQNIPGVLYAEPDYYRESSLVPNDPDFWRQWGLSNTGQVFKEDTASGIAGADIDAPIAWNTSTNSKEIVAVLDSGIDYLHPDLSSNIWTDPSTWTHGYDAITGTLEPMDLASHGTHCAGIIGGVGNNSIGITGVNWNTTILPVRFLNSFGTGTVSDEIEAILWAARNGATIYSCSYGGSDPSQAEYEVMAGTAGLFICAAGNSGLDNDAIPHYPTSYDLENIISVAATNAQDNLASFSNYGKTSVDIAAPGEDIYSAKHNLYSPEPLWYDSFDTLSNWTTHGNWTLNTEYYTSPPSSAQGTVNNTGNYTEIPAILTLKEPLRIENLTNPIISYDLQLIGANYTFSIEGSNDNISWTKLEYDRKSFVLMPFTHRECKITTDLLKNPLYLRFIGDGTFITCFLDNVTLSEGYGTLTETRYGYMSGTSMAAPFVSGMSANLKTYAPDASYSMIKEAIMKSSDPLADLQNKTVTGGRVNLSAAMVYLKNPDTDKIRLYPGWNHVSVAKRLMSGNDTASDVFGKVTNTSGHSVLKYFNTTWITVQGDEIISPLSSYWIWTGDTQNITVKPDENQSGVYLKELLTGWNGFGVYGTVTLPAKDTLLQIGDNWTYVVGYDAKTGQYEEPIIRNSTSDSLILLPWQGYWLYVTDNVTYQVTN
ncbi:S8 family serine peptidase [Methanospirillum stamsii]|uniref:Peptidase S8/S53 domain-containing protein n=1 Tax=Methanospirillum stamsii TaxID=1277351 RepID=A0A2V2MS55_9EURY|nr:S8 family serine peptidase [Methanospirillum stamsii]PWR71064.1 hypothetical protein DLD82_14275 [Methanospirillum stamsii]